MAKDDYPGFEKLWKNGVSAAHLAARYKCAVRTVYFHAQRLGLARRDLGAVKPAPEPAPEPVPRKPALTPREKKARERAREREAYEQEKAGASAPRGPRYTYGDLVELREREGLSYRQAMQRFHRMRG